MDAAVLCDWRVAVTERPVMKTALTSQRRNGGEAKGPLLPPIAKHPGDSVPVAGIYRRLKAIITDPVGLIERSAAAHGQIFTVKTPFSFDVTYILGREAFQTVMALPAGHANVGPVFGSLPTVGYWFPREADDDESLQELILLGRKLAARLVASTTVDRIAEVASDVVTRRTQRWTDMARLDLATETHSVIYEVAFRVLLGDVVWKDIDPSVIARYRAIVDGIDVTRAALAKTPLHRFMLEYRATQDLYGILRQAYRRYSFGSGRSPLFDAVNQARQEFGLADADAIWMVMYILWNAAAYPGAYGIWTLVDILEHPSLVAAVQLREDREDRDAAAYRRELLSRCFFETLRMNPVSALVRYLGQPLDIQVSGKDYRIPAGGYVAVYPAGIANDPDSVQDHYKYDPDRFLSQSPRPLALFGRGPFGCVAAEFSKHIISTVLGELLHRHDLTLAAAPPPKVCRVGLTYPAGAVWARAERRLNTNVPTPAMAKNTKATQPLSI
jgi:cytochrome P450